MRRQLRAVSYCTNWATILVANTEPEGRHCVLAVGVSPRLALINEREPRSGGTLVRNNGSSASGRKLTAESPMANNTHILRPRVACEITAERVAAARINEGGNNLE